MNIRSFNVEDRLLGSTYDEALFQNESQEMRWRNFKEEHEALSSRLLSLREKLKHDIMVPIGKLALMKGKLIHTNDILVSLGDGWFTKKSTTEATELCKRRIKDCDEMLNKLKKEKDLLMSRKAFPMEHNLFSSDEVIEPYDEAAEAEWKEKHRERVRAHKQAEAKKRRENKLEDVEDLFTLLDALELQEEEDDELNRLEFSENDQKLLDEYKLKFYDVSEDSDTDTDEDSDDNPEDEENIDKCNSEKESRPSEKDSKLTTDNFLENNRIHLLEEGKTISNLVDNSEDNHSVSSCIRKTSFKNVRKVSFAEHECSNDIVEELDPIIIRIKHSDVLPKSSDIDSVCEGKQEIRSPSDIYKSIVHPSGVPKSILKKSISLSHDVEEERGERLVEKSNLEDVRRIRSEAESQVKIGDIIERSVVPPSTQISSERRVSKFKASRQTIR